MLLDLNVRWNRVAAHNLLHTAAELGFSGIAFNVVLDPSQESIKNHHCPITDGDILQFQQYLAPYIPNQFMIKTKFDELNLSCLRNRDNDLDSNHCFLILRRLTVIINKVSDINILKLATQQFSHVYDILAAQTSDQKIWMSLAKDADCDIISLDYSIHPFPLKLNNSTIGLATSRGIYFEICLAKLLKDSMSRSNIISNCSPIILKGGNHVIFTSGAVDELELRSPYDISNIADVLGVKGSGSSLSVVRNNAVEVLYKASSRRSGGYINVAHKTQSVANSAILEHFKLYSNHS